MRARRFLGAAAMAAVALVLASPAAAAPALHDSISGTFHADAGDLCSFEYSQSFTVNLVATPLPNGNYIEHDQVYVTHVNETSGYTLTEHDTTTFILNVHRGVTQNVGVFWHLRDASGKVVVVQAGQLTFDLATGDLIKVTPGFNPDFAAVLCPALGGTPAG